MCGRFTLTKPVKVVADLFGLPEVPAELQPRYNVAPRQRVPVVAYNPAKDVRGLAQLSWGFVPHTAADLKMRSINARSETVASSPWFGEAFANKRCLLPADGFYEWQAVGKAKVPVRFTLAGGGLFAFAGLWDCWRGDTERLVSCCLLTTKPNDLVATVHDRMPVILTADQWAAWLDPDAPLDRLRALLRPYTGEMDAHEASPLVNKAGNEGPELLAA